MALIVLVLLQREEAGLGVHLEMRQVEELAVPDEGLSLRYSMRQSLLQYYLYQLPLPGFPLI